MAFSRKRIYLIPLDSRPVCYDMPRRMAAMAGLELSMPAPSLLGRLKTPANFKSLGRWVKNHLFENDPLIVALDTVAYGGLIPSRVNSDSLDTLAGRVARFFEQIQVERCFGFSSILRIPNYDIEEEEPAYWRHYGRLLYQYSADMHAKGHSGFTSRIPADVLADFTARREKNHALNQTYLDRLADGTLDYLTYCQDDTGPFGLNVQEAQALEAAIERRDLGAQAHIQTGADEVACVMLARWMALQADKALKIYPFYSAEAGRQLVARFDGRPIEDVVTRAIRAAGAQPAKRAADADLWLMVHTPEARQGDHCSRLEAQVTPEQADEVVKVFEKALHQGKPLAIADVAYANGSDPRLSHRLLEHFDDLTGLYGYAGWNTPGNTIGTAVSMGLIRVMAERSRRFDTEAFCQLMLIRLADDWLYQADVRQTVRSLMNGSGQPDEALLNVCMADGLALLKRRLGLESQTIHCRFPCNRTFEVDIQLS